MKILMVIAKDGFQDHEFQIPYDYFQKKNFTVDVASISSGDCIGKFGAVVPADRSFSDVVIQEYFAVVLVGGPGSKDLVGNKELEQILNKAVKQDILVAAICYAPMILVAADLLKGKSATVWDGDKLQSPILKDNNVNYVEKDAVKDGNFITANGPKAAKRFAEEIIATLECSDCWMKK